MSADTIELLIARLRREYPASMYSRVRDHAPVGSHAWATLDLWDTLDALESSCAEVDRLRDELARLRSAPVAVEVPDLDNYETRPCEPLVSNEDPEDWYAIAQWESERADAWKAFAELNLQDPSRIPKDGDGDVVASKEDLALCAIPDAHGPPVFPCPCEGIRIAFLPL